MGVYSTPPPLPQPPAVFYRSRFAFAWNKPWLVIRQKGKPQNEGNKKTKCVRISGGMCSFSGKFGTLCFLVTTDSPFFLVTDGFVDL